MSVAEERSIEIGAPCTRTSSMARRASASSRSCPAGAMVTSRTRSPIATITMARIACNRILNLVIITYYTMKPPVMNRSEIKDFPFQRMNIRLDKDGCLYMVESREMLKNLGAESQAGLEAMGALRMAGKVMHLPMERWAERHGLSEGRMSVPFRLGKA